MRFKLILVSMKFKKNICHVKYNILFKMKIYNAHNLIMLSIRYDTYSLNGNKLRLKLSY